MDIKAILRQLYAERKRIERVIASMEQFLKSGAAGASRSAVFTGRRQGRKSMGQKERREVSKRMKTYWAKRRAPLEDKSKLE